MCRAGLFCSLAMTTKNKTSVLHKTLILAMSETVKTAEKVLLLHTAESNIHTLFSKLLLIPIRFTRGE